MGASRLYALRSHISRYTYATWRFIGHDYARIEVCIYTYILMVNSKEDEEEELALGVKSVESKTLLAISNCTL